MPPLVERRERGLSRGRGGASRGLMKLSGAQDCFNHSALSLSGMCWATGAPRAAVHAHNGPRGSAVSVGYPAAA
eukprot:1085033-Rhodomonas_salina.3